MRAVAPSTDYYARLIKKLDQQETQIEAWQKEQVSLQTQLDSQRKALEQKIVQLNVE
jgi:septal ring factor EnvC (AmiA/AmiB activator)